MGALDSLSEYISDYFHVSRKRKKRKVKQTVNIKVKMDCDGCERRVKNAVSSMKGVETVELNRKIHKVTVSGYVEPKKVLKRVERTGKKAEIWPYVPYNVVAYPYAVGAYDKKAPAGYVRRSDQSQPLPGAPDDVIMSLFSDENPNACTVM
ncbi:Heavy metal transport/detoxification superfamily protein [Raphanus sativus]|uniref:Heavy metal-associated isoprenylated plant protein 20 n=1 Tax=Raphanus sativus TaxID=3726 RepID=A0A6J0L4U3_RAPSA|nr:heavy metal-associated isoprenylated plant protein 20 [Raphanus sativus]KAJ4874812.1 Heavy metal transport/detoxification superfamily protein [Raphanus sativus]